MTGKDKRPDTAAELRRRAEEVFQGKTAQFPENLETLSSEETRQALHELRVHQIELEMQNEELQRVQVGLDAVRARYFDLYDMAPVGYCTLSEKGLILEGNLTAASLLGMERGALAGQPFSRCILKEDQDSYYLCRRQLFETGAPQVGEMRMVKKDATLFWARLEMAIAQDAVGTPVCRAVMSDITERKRVDEALQKEHKRLYEVLEALPAMICLLTPDYHVVFANHSFRKKYGESNGRHCYVYCYGRKEPCEFCESYKVLKTGKPHRWVVSGPDGSIIDVYNYPFTDVDGSPLILKMDIDITERKKMEAALQESEVRFRELFNRMSSGGAVYEAIDNGGDFIFRDFNPAAEKMDKVSRKDILGRRVSEAFPGVKAFGLFEVFQRVWQTGKPEYHPDNIYKDERNPGGWRENWVFKLPTGEIVAIYNDITGRKRAEEREMEMERRILRAQKLESLGVLAGGIAHDFNNLLTAILGNLDLARYDISPSSPACTSIEGAIHATRRAETLTRQMLAYSGKGRFIVDDMDLSELVEENAHLLKTAVSKSTTLSHRLDRELPAISADAGQIQQVVMNLIMNASESLGEQAGTVALSTGVTDCDEACLSHSWLLEKPTPGRFVFLEVTDTGCGMDEETQQHIFDPFFTTKFTGRGLGMSAVLGIVRGHKGAIVVKSEVGKGTTIRVLFPVSKSAPVEHGPKEKAANGRIRDAGKPLLSGIVLVVDDDVYVRAPCAVMVAHAGYRALSAENGDEAVAIFREHADEIVCVILDLTMPGMDGAATFEALRKIKPDVRVILSSGYDEQEATQRFSGQGLAGFIQKPYEMTALLAELGRVVRGDGLKA